MRRTTARDFVLGVNYWPRRKAMSWWQEFDHAEVEAEFDEIYGLGLRVVRIFLLWEEFQPQPTRIDDGALRNLEVVLNTAAATGLKVIPTFFTGHVCGANWIPSWALGDVQPHRRFPHITEGQQTTRGICDIYSDPAMLEAQILQVQLVTSVFARHRAIYAWDLGNEHDKLLQPKTPQLGQRWVELLSEEIRRNDTQHPVTFGLDALDLERDRHFRPEDIAPFTDFLSVHGYSILTSWARGPLDTDVAPFLVALTTTLSGKPTLAEEFGVCTLPPDYPPSGQLGTPGNVFCSTDEEAATYYREVLEKLRLVGALGVLAWCFSDFDPCVWDRPPLNFAVHQRYFGITTSQGDVKPSGAILRQFAHRKPQIVTPPRTIDLGMSAADYYRAPASHLVALYRAFLKE